MFKREIWGIPTGMWLVGVVYLALTALLRSYYVDYESLRQIAAVAEGFRRDSLGFWSGHAPLGMLLFWALTKPFALVFPLLESAQVLGAVAITLTGLILYRIFRMVGLSGGLSGWLTGLFYFSNVVLNAATMFSFAAIALFLMAWWAKTALHTLAPREADPVSLTRLGVVGGLLCGINLFALFPAIAVGVAATRRGRAGGYWAGLWGVMLVVYLAVYFAVLPNPVMAYGVERPKPSFVEWIATGGVGSAITIPRFSGLYWQATGEQAQNALLALGRPFRVRDVYQYYAAGTFVTLLKGAFLALGLLTLILLIVVATTGERIISDRLVSLTRQIGGYSLALSLIALILWKGDYQPLYLWTLFWALMGLGGWLASYVEEDVQRVVYGFAPLVLVMVLFGLIKQSGLRSAEIDGERQEAEAVREVLTESTTAVAATRIAEWLRYYAAGRARVVATEYWLQPDADFRQLLQSAQQNQQRLIVWQYALDPEIYRKANLPVKITWLEALEKAKAEFDKGEGGRLRGYARIVIYPTLIDQWVGEVHTYGEAPKR
ncbi:MAG: hypothetical protein K6U12_05340 [Armatimonadetes bacterium]|nr:hypothetical protein [Armatimonadota bacterium]CUU38411.1 Predicted membrane protein (DUF2079) [Armatimonadetes bacterium DC]